MCECVLSCNEIPGDVAKLAIITYNVRTSSKT
jgi:hypothetical protein